MTVKIADVVRSTAGRDKGDLFFVMSAEKDRVLVADGKTRKISKQKSKNPKHIEYVCSGPMGAAQKIKSGSDLTNKELIRALAEVKAGFANNELEVCALGKR